MYHNFGDNLMLLFLCSSVAPCHLPEWLGEAAMRTGSGCCPVGECSSTELMREATSIVGFLITVSLRLEFYYSIQTT